MTNEVFTLGETKVKMMHKTDAGTSSRHQQLLRDLKSTVEGLLVSQVANVWYIYGGLNRLHSDVDKIFRNGCKVSSDGVSCVCLFLK